MSYSKAYTVYQAYKKGELTFAKASNKLYDMGYTFTYVSGGAINGITGIFIK